VILRGHGFADPRGLTEARAGSIIDSLSGKRQPPPKKPDTEHKTYINTRRKKTWPIRI
jgi:hypothetical protein